MGSETILEKFSLDPKDFNSFILMTNAPLRGKFLEQMVTSQLQALGTRRSNLDPCQSGFRPDFGKKIALVTLYADFEKEARSVNLTILEEEKLQQEERMRMESRRQVTVSWDSGGSDEAPPKPSRPGYPSPRSSEGFYPSPQHMVQPNHYQVSGYPSSHGIPAMAGSVYPGQASLLDQTDSWNHRPQEISMWQPSVEQDPGSLDLRGMGQVLPAHLMEERLIRQQQEMEEDQRWLEKEERFLKPDVRLSRGSIDRDDGSLQGPASNQHIYQPVGKPDHSAPPKKPPRPGAPSHLGSLASLNSPVDSYNEGVKGWATDVLSNIKSEGHGFGVRSGVSNGHGTPEVSTLACHQIQPQEISPPPTANLDRSNDKVYENVTGLVKAVIEMSSKIQPAPPEEYVPMVKEVGLALRTLLATVDETIPVFPASTHREIEMAQKLLNSDLAELINKMKLAQQYVMTSLQQEYKKQMLTAAHALAVDAKNLLDAFFKMVNSTKKDEVQTMVTLMELCTESLPAEIFEMFRIMHNVDLLKVERLLMKVFGK
ncbi:Focal adhesion kinase 1 [Varanus komodoensis]|nr:Focal adhesion kinase 1 [Varanus komodoensis]